MLVLSRKKHEAIIFTTELGDVKVQVVDVRGDVVRLGIECDKKIPVHREEVYDAIKMEAKQREKEHIKEEPKKDNSITQEQLLGIIKDALKEQVAGSSINNVEINETDGKWEMTITTDNGDDLQYWRIKPVEVDKRTW